MEKFLVIASVALALFVSNASNAAIKAQAIDQSAARQFGKIKGRVLDDEGKPVSGAEVSVKIIGRPSTGGYLWSTDRSGRFVIPHVQPGTYALYATKNQDSYNDISFAFFYLTRPWTVEVTVKPRVISKGIVIRMYSSKARLTGALIDAETGQLIKDATLFLCHKDRNSCIGVNNDRGGRFHVLVPTIPLRVRAYAPGYQDWYYGKDSSKEHAEDLRLEPNTNKELTIPLRRSK